MNDCYNSLFREQNDVIFNAINWLDKEDVSGLVRVTELRKVSAKRRDFSAPLIDALRAIQKDWMGSSRTILLSEEPMQEALS